MGHPDSGTNWEEFADAGIKRSGFKPMGEEWPACYYHHQLKLMLVVYVDALNLPDPNKIMKKYNFSNLVLSANRENKVRLSFIKIQYMHQI